MYRILDIRSKFVEASENSVEHREIQPGFRTRSMSVKPASSSPTQKDCLSWPRS